MTVLAALIVALVIVGLLAFAWMKRTPDAFVTEPVQAAATSAERTSYRSEIQASLRKLSPLEISTLKHLRRQGSQTFTADRDSVVLRRLVQRNLLHPMGSSARSPDAYPYRIPDAVWAELETTAEPERSRGGSAA